MIFRMAPLAAALILAGCATVSNETRTAAYVQGGFHDGIRYDIRTRTIDGRNGSYEQTSVIYRGISSTCIPTSPRDCELAALRIIESYDLAF